MNSNHLTVPGSRKRRLEDVSGHNEDVMREAFINHKRMWDPSIIQGMEDCSIYEESHNLSSPSTNAGDDHHSSINSSPAYIAQPDHQVFDQLDAGANHQMLL